MRLWTSETLVLRVERRRSRRWSAAAGADVFGAHPRVVCRRREIFGSLAAGNCLVKQLLQEWPAPAAAGPSTVAVGQLGRALGLLHAEVVDHLPFGDVEAEAELVVEIHRGSIWRGRDWRRREIRNSK